MLTDLCQELRNWFEKDKHFGTFTISGGALSSTFLQDGQYFRIVGSVFNDGVWKYGTDGDQLTDETFDGAVWALAIPKAVLTLNDEIDAWIAEYGAVTANPYSSESFGGYSYVKASASGSGSSGNITWQNTFASKLNRWRKI